MRQKEDPQRVRARARAWYYANKERRLAYLKIWQKANPDKMRQYSRASTQRRAKQVYENTRRWRLLNRERRNTQNANRRARVAGADGYHTTGEWEALKMACGFTCQGCKRREPEIKLTRDHIVPISKGGSNHITNIQPLCGRCNSRKNAKLPIVDVATLCA